MGLIDSCGFVSVNNLKNQGLVSGKNEILWISQWEEFKPKYDYVGRM